MYHKHRTQALVLSGYESGENNKKIILFTRELGMIQAHVQAGRSMISKLRPSIQDFTFGTYTLLKGRREWKLVGAEAQYTHSHFLNYGEGTIDRLAEIGVLLRRLNDYEYQSEDLFEALYQFLEFLPTASGEEEYAKTLTVLRILRILGYFDGEREYSICFNSPFIGRDELSFLKENDKKVKRAIEMSLQVSGF